MTCSARTGESDGPRKTTHPAAATSVGEEISFRSVLSRPKHQPTPATGCMLLFSTGVVYRHSRASQGHRRTHAHGNLELSPVPSALAPQSSKFQTFMALDYRAGAAIMLVTSANALAYNVIHNAMIKMTSAVTTTVIGEAKIVGLFILSALLLGELASRPLLACWIMFVHSTLACIEMARKLGSSLDRLCCHIHAGAYKEYSERYGKLHETLGVLLCLETNVAQFMNDVIELCHGESFSGLMDSCGDLPPPQTEWQICQLPSFSSASECSRPMSSCSCKRPHVQRMMHSL